MLASCSRWRQIAPDPDAVVIALLISQNKAHQLLCMSEVPFAAKSDPNSFFQRMAAKILPSLGTICRDFDSEHMNLATAILSCRCSCHGKPAPKYHTKGCSHSCVDSPGARTLVFVAFETFLGAEFRASIARTPFCATLWRSPTRK